MPLPYPEFLFHRLVPVLPEIPVWGWRMAGGTGLLAAAVAIALYHPWVGAPLLLIGALAATMGEVRAFQEHKPAAPVLILGLLAVLFGFGLADPSRALAAMFLMFGLSAMTLLGGPKGERSVAAVTWLAVAAFLTACFLPSSFSLSAYIIGILAFIAAGQGVAKAWS